MKKLPLCLLLLPCAAMVVSLATAQEKANSLKTGAYQTSVSQEQLRAQTRRLKDEMLTLLGEFSQYKLASNELKKLQETLESLDTVSENDMRAVVQTLREASRMDDIDAAKEKLVAASGEQKEIQALLRKLADRLAMQKDEAAMRQRLNKLALRQLAANRDARELAATGLKAKELPHEMKTTLSVGKAEQEAVRDEVKMAMETLRNLVEKSESPAKEKFAAALQKAEAAALEEKAKEAAEKMTEDFAAANQAGEQVLKNLQEMIADLDAGKSAEDKSRELAQEMKELAQQQDRLAEASSKRWGDSQGNIRQEQERVSDRIEMAQDALEKLNAEAAANAAEAAKGSEAVADSLKEKKFLEKADNAAATADAQHKVADTLEAAGKKLEAQADALAAQDNPAGEEGLQADPATAAAQEAISNAVQQVMEAKSEIALAERQLQQEGSQEAAKQRLGEAGQKLEAAKAAAAEAGEAVPGNVGEELTKAGENVAKGRDGVGVGSKQDQEKSRWNLDRAEENADRALAGLQQAANQMAAKAAGEKGQQASKQGKNKGSKSDTNGPAGGKIDSRGEESSVSAVSKMQGGQREALSLLQQEKAPAEYETMVQQYIRNLADGELPSQ